jgi:hypothetical protein
MTKTIDFFKFKKLLNENDIYLFDSYYRIAHHRFNNLQYNNIPQNKQVGGSGKMNKIILSRLVNSLLTNNTDRINWILQNNVF